MGKQRCKFETGFKQQIVGEIESGLLSVNAASRKEQISGSVIDRWRWQARQGLCRRRPQLGKKLWNGRIVNSRRNSPSCIWRMPS
jgi:transposase-like protein